MGNTSEETLGENLVYHTENMLNNIFTDVKFSYKHSNNSINNTERYLMIPKFIYFGHTESVSLLKEVKTSITIQWEIVKKTGEHVWAETITGTYLGTFKGSSIENSYQQIYKEALIDLFKKSQEEILSSNLLRNLQ